MVKLYIKKNEYLERIRPHDKACFGFKRRREHIVIVNIPNLVYPNQKNSFKIPHSSSGMT